MTTMNHDDPRLTAYALGELPEGERAEVEAFLANSAEARETVAEIQAMAKELETGFAGDTATAGAELTDDQRATILAAPASSTATPATHWYRGRMGILRVSALAATLVIAVGVALNETYRNQKFTLDESAASLSARVAGRRDASGAAAVEFDRNGIGYPNGLVDSPAASSPVPNPAPPRMSNQELIQRLQQLGYLSGQAEGKKSPTERPEGRELDSTRESREAKLRAAAPPPAEKTEAKTGDKHVRDEAEKTKVAVLSDVDRVRIPETIEDQVEDVEKPVDGVTEAEFQTESYAPIEENPFHRVSDESRSTFSIDVDTASYSNARRFLAEGRLPPPAAVRVEEFVNYFTYAYPEPDAGQPFSITTETARCPWKTDHQLVLVGLKGRSVSIENRKPLNLAFLIDVSGSMNSADKLPLVQRSLKILTEQLDHRDRISIVVYAGSSGLVLPATSGQEQSEIAAAIDRLQAGGSTNGGQGIELAYKVAQESFRTDGVNRVILCTDGDFNVGITDRGSLLSLIEEKRKSGVFLSVLGFGTGNTKDDTMELLADKGNGNYAYVDSLAEARKVLAEQVGGTLEVIAKDVKIQVEFNPATVEAFRLVGYENRILQHQDFNDDTKDAGEIGAGIAVTALYEIVPKGVAIDLPKVDEKRYQDSSESLGGANFAGELMYVKLRHKAPDGDVSKLIEMPLCAGDHEFRSASENLRFATSVAAFAMKLRGSRHVGDLSYEKVLAFAQEARGLDPGGYRAEFLTLVEKARALSK